MIVMSDDEFKEVNHALTVTTTLFERFSRQFDAKKKDEFFSQHDNLTSDFLLKPELYYHIQILDVAIYISKIGRSHNYGVVCMGFRPSGLQCSDLKKNSYGSFDKFPEAVYAFCRIVAEYCSFLLPDDPMEIVI